MIDTNCLVKSAPRALRRTAQSRNAAKVMKQLPETVIESHFATADGRDSSLGSRLDSDAFRAELQKRANTPLYIPNQPRHWGLNE